MQQISILRAPPIPPPPSYALSVTDDRRKATAEKEKHGFGGEGKCAFLVVAACPCLVFFSLLFTVAFFVLTFRVFCSGKLERQQERGDCSNIGFEDDEVVQLIYQSKADRDEVDRICKDLQLSLVKDGIREDNKQQDQELDELSLSVQRIGHVGLTIHDELIEQERIMDDLGAEIGSTSNRLDFLQKKVAFVMKKAGVKGQLMIILFMLALFIMVKGRMQEESSLRSSLEYKS